MRLIEQIPNTPQTPIVAAIGFFDGVHCGHRFLIDILKETARKKGVECGVITFRNHPRSLLNNESLQLLNSYDERIHHLELTEIDRCIVLDFTPAIACLTAYQFLEFLATNHHVTTLFVGYNHHFGSNKSDGFEQYKIYGKKLGIEVIKSPEFTLENTKISSSNIRKYLEWGCVEEAHQALGYPYSLRGTVTKGQGIGHNIGFPTANIVLDINQSKQIPLSGVYGVRVKCNWGRYIGMLNMGIRPTFDEHESTFAIEVHLINFSENLYNQPIEIEFYHFLRQERKMKNTAQLITQLYADKRQVERLFASDTHF